MGETDEEQFDHGARFIRAALQVNPYQYLIKNGKPVDGMDEAGYNQAVVDACLAGSIEVIAVTDHFAIDDSQSLIDLARQNGIVAFPGFEVVTADGVHFLCIFDEDTPNRTIQNCIGACGVVTLDDEGDRGKLTSQGLLESAHEWGAVIIAAHVSDKGGLLTKLSGSTREGLWANENLTAVALSKSIADVGSPLDGILNGRVKEYQPKYPPAIIYAADVIAPGDLASKKAWTSLKVSTFALDGVRHAFLDPGSRVRLPDDSEINTGCHLSSISWRGGFLNGVKIPLNSALNVLIGPRGAGKSTVLESIRYALGLVPLGDDARKSHKGFVENVLGPGTVVTLEVTNPDMNATWTIERAVNGKASVKRDGNILQISPSSLIGDVEFFGQHEVAELAKLPEARSKLLARFVPGTTSTGRSNQQVADDLHVNRSAIIAEMKTVEKLGKQQERLPIVDEQLAQYETAGLRGRIEEEARFEKEEPIITDAQSMLDDLSSKIDELDSIDLEYLADDTLKDLPSESGLTEFRAAMEVLAGEWERSKSELRTKLESARESFENLATTRDQARAAKQDEYLAVLRDLKSEQVNGVDILELEKEKAKLESNAKKLREAKKRERTFRDTRATLLTEYEGLKRREFDKLEVAAKKVTKELKPTVRVSCRFEGSREALETFLREKISGQLDTVINAINSAGEAFGPRALADACRVGQDAVEKLLGISSGVQVKRVAELSEKDLLEMEEIWLEPTTDIALKVGATSDGRPIWRGLENLSTGEKATAILLILLLGSNQSSPLVIDQAEDDLDNAFIADDIVKKLRAEKSRRQFVMSTHNPNIPVLGDAEQVVRLTPQGEAASGGSATVKPEHIGSLDKKSVRSVVEALEGGREAFESRRRRYGY